MLCQLIPLFFIRYKSVDSTISFGNSVASHPLTLAKLNENDAQHLLVMMSVFFIHTFGNAFNKTVIDSARVVDAFGAN